MKPITILLTIGLAILLIILPLTTVIGSNHIQSTTLDNPLFNTRIQRLINPFDTTGYSTYVGQYIQNSLPIPSRTLITPDTINQLQQQAPILQNTETSNQYKWSLILEVLPQLLDHLNSYYRENVGEIKQLLSNYKKMDATSLEQLLFEKIEQISIEDLQNLQTLQPTIPQQNTNITSSIICNITSGSICSITSQPICALTLHPICALITMTPPCHTLMGVRCPTAGIKCNPPTTGALCLFMKNLGPIFKAILLIILIGFILFLPALLLVTIFVPDACTNIRNRVTMWLNCTTNSTSI